MVDVDWALKQISSIYHSERHFQLSLGAELGRMYEEKRVRMEWEPLPRTKVDIGVRRDDVTIPIELKYKTESATVEDEGFGETFELSRQGARDQAHYRFLQDIYRVEEIVAEQGRYGYAILLTNDANYWSHSGYTALHDEMRVHEGAELGGSMHWSGKTNSDWIERKKWRDPIELEGQYTAEWSDYEYRDNISVTGNSDFRYLVFRIG
ncbi:hypothetical protein [Halomarina pelagica]|uniref:hypothetical protein n=1 Tax=Halomarina pelagica TaxID=2961599 RepID=UPI0020C37AAA|nr:hypothetical protein [Halomarina sp. BND7]